MKEDFLEKSSNDEIFLLFFPIVVKFDRIENRLFSSITKLSRRNRRFDVNNEHVEKSKLFSTEQNIDFIRLFSISFFRQDLNSSSMYESGLAMSGLSCFINADLARDLANDIMSLVKRKKTSENLFGERSFV